MPNVYASVNGVTDIIDLTVTGAQGSACAQFDFHTPDSGFSVNEVVSITMGVDDDTQVALSGGYIDTVTAERPPGLYHIEGRDKLKLALDYFIVAASLDEADFFNPRLDNSSTSPSDIVSDLLALCGLTLGGSSGDGGWELGTEEEGTPFQLVSAWDAIQQVCSIGAWRVWCTADGTITFGPSGSVGAGAASFTTGDSGNIISVSYSKSVEDLRNKIVVIGAIDPDNGNFTATASAASPYLPSGFYKTAVISTDLIGDQDMATASAAANLARFNRLNERTTLTATGTGIGLYGNASVAESFTSAPGGMVVAVTHSIDSNGYRTELTAGVVP